MAQLTFQDHTRKFTAFKYIYPVVSRRSQGLSLGVNLNTNNACNWRCIYCQVENLVRGKPESIDLAKLEAELDYMLDSIVHGDFLEKNAPSGLQHFSDIALSGNGESTLAKEFLSVVKIIAKLRQKYHLNAVKTILITNGSELDKPMVQHALAILAENDGAIWFKVDSATVEGLNRVNQVHVSLSGIEQRLRNASTICSTYIQTCLFRSNGQNPTEIEIEAYITFVAKIKNMIAGVLLYSTARNPALTEGEGITQVSDEFLAGVAKRIAALGVEVKYYV